jgi:23S rRNA (cytidine1920-2'-O)/16S rRNA (cytidine1409-2'-O)-methyltransferase
VDGRVVSKSGTQVSDKSVIEIKAKSQNMYVGDALINWCMNYCALKYAKSLLSEAYNHPFFLQKIKFRTGHKLEAAIKEFGIDCDGKIALDSG